MENLNWADWVIIIFLTVSTLFGVLRGFVRESLSLLTWAVASFIAYKNYTQLAEFCTFIDTEIIRQGASFFAIFMGVMIVGGLVSYWLAKLVKWGGLGTVDRLAGLLFGAGRGLAVVLLITFTLPTDEAWVTSSALIPRLEPYSSRLVACVPVEIADKIKQLESYI